MKIIINADDFGYSAGTNHGIERALERGLISSTTMLPNMSGFEEAVILAKQQKFNGRVGIHLNLFEGRPLTEEMRACKIFCDNNGNFHGKKIKFYAPLLINSKIIYNELFAQITKLINAGIKPTHLDSHGHIHTNFFIGNIVIKLAKQFNISSIRISSNLRRKKNIIRPIEIFAYNNRLRRNGIKCVDYIGTIPEIIAALPELKGIIEIIAHPVCKGTTLVDSELKGDLAILLDRFRTVQKISYSEL